MADEELERLKQQIKILHRGFAALESRAPRHRNIKKIQLSDAKYKSAIEEEREFAAFINENQKEFNALLGELIGLAQAGDHDWVLENETQLKVWMESSFMQPVNKQKLQEIIQTANAKSRLEEPLSLISQSLNSLNVDLKKAEVAFLATHQRNLNTAIKQVVALIPRNEKGEFIEPSPIWLQDIQASLENWSKSQYVNKEVKHQLKKVLKQESFLSSNEQDRMEFVKKYFTEMLPQGENRVSADYSAKQVQVQLESHSPSCMALKSILDQYQINYVEKNKGNISTFSIVPSEKLFTLLNSPSIYFKNYYNSLVRAATGQIELQAIMKATPQVLEKKRIVSFRDESQKGPLQEVKAFKLDTEQKKGTKKGEPTRHRKVYKENIPASTHNISQGTTSTLLPDEFLKAAEHYLESCTLDSLAKRYGEHFKKSHLKFGDATMGSFHAHVTHAQGGGYKVQISFEDSQLISHLNPKFKRMVVEASQDSAVFSESEIKKMAESFDKSLSPQQESDIKPKRPQ